MNLASELENFLKTENEIKFKDLTEVNDIVCPIITAIIAKPFNKSI